MGIRIIARIGRPSVTENVMLIAREIGPKNANPLDTSPQHPDIWKIRGVVHEGADPLKEMI